MSAIVDFQPQLTLPSLAVTLLVAALSVPSSLPVTEAFKMEGEFENELHLAALCKSLGNLWSEDDIVEVRREIPF